MKNTATFRRLSLLIALKRYKRNSVILKKNAKYKLAKELNISVHLLSKYIREAKDAGYVEETMTSYKIVGLKKILIDIYHETGLVFKNHRILSGGDHNYKEILLLVERYYLLDNVYAPQKFIIDRNKKELSYVKLIKATAKKRKSLPKEDYDYMKKLIKKYGSWECAVKKITKKSDFKFTAITSQRHSSLKLGVSPYKANGLLSSLHHVGMERKINSIFIKGCSIENFELAKVKYPKATIIPLLNSDVVKVCLPSSFSEGAKFSF